MARKVQDIVITADGRDQGKTFRITQMPATKAEKWGIRATLALGHAGYQVPESMMGGGMAVLASIGFNALLRVNFYEIEPLLDEMFEGVVIVTDAARDITRKLIEDDTEEVATLLTLREAVAALELGFSPVERLRTWVSLIKERELSSNLTPTSET